MYGKEYKCKMTCESCGKFHHAPVLDRWTCDCRLSIIIEEVQGKEVNRRVNNKSKK